MTFVVKLFFCLILFAGCSGFLRKDVSGLPLDPVTKAKQANDLNTAQSFFNDENYQKSLELFQKFKLKNSSSPFFQQAQFGEAKSFEKLGKWSEAVVLYREIIEATRTTQPEIAAEALYESSYSYEELGDEARVFSSLLDALNMKKYLREEVFLAEIPARLAASANRMSRTSEAKKYLLEADRGIQNLITSRPHENQKDWVAKTYYQMGRVSMNQLSLDNFQANLDSIKSVQTFALRSIESGDTKWSAKSLEALRGSYHNLVSLIEQVQLNQALDIAAAHRELTERKSRMAGEILSAINLLRKNKLPDESVAGNENTFSKELFLYLDIIEAQLLTYLNSRGVINELTPESNKIQELNRKQ